MGREPILSSMKTPKAVSVKIESKSLAALRAACKPRGISMTWALSRAAESEAALLVADAARMVGK